MRTGRSRRTTTAVAAACLMLPLWISSCAVPSEFPPAGPDATLAAGPVPSPVGAPLTPPAGVVPAPVPAPPASPGGNGGASASGSTAAAPSGTSAAATTSGAATGTATGGPASAAPSGSASGPAPDAASGGTATAPAPSPAASPARTAAPAGPAVYYVALDDGGSSGVRFGCNDSLVPVRSGAATDDPLTTALGRLFDPANTTAQEAGLYNALSGSAVHFVSGYFSGTTVVVDLSGPLRPGGVCDNPRIEAQLTQTIVAATGASRAEIYIDGKTLAEVLSLR